MCEEHIHIVSKQCHNMLEILKILCKLGLDGKCSQILAERNRDAGRAKCSGQSMRKIISDDITTFKQPEHRLKAASHSLHILLPDFKNSKPFCYTHMHIDYGAMLIYPLTLGKRAYKSL